MKTVIEMAKEAGFMVVHECEPKIGAWYECFTDEIERFAELVRADEREACAKVAEDMNAAVLAMLNVTRQPIAIAAAIRARS